MKSQNYSTTFTVDRAPEDVFDAINDVRGWWTGQIEGETDSLGAEFTYVHPKMHYSKQKITEFVPGQRVVWHVTEADLTFVQDKKEWEGTDIIFDITPKNGKTEVRFEHVGLSPDVECYDGCSDAWSYYVNDSLKKYINGKARAHSK